MLRYRRDATAPIVLGIEPAKEFVCMSRYCSEVSELTLEGMMPLIRLKPTSSLVRLPKFPIETGNVPVSVINDSTTLSTLA